MTLKKRLFGALAVALLAPFAPAQDWPQDGGPNRTFAIASPAPFKADWGKASPPILWQAHVGRGFSPVAVVGNRVIAVGGFQHGTDPAQNEYIRLDPLGWSRETAKLFRANQKSVPPTARNRGETGVKVNIAGLPGADEILKRLGAPDGIVTSGEYTWRPDIHGGNSTTQALNREDTWASCFDAGTGKLLWRTKVAEDCITSYIVGGGPAMTRAAPLVADGLAYFHSFDGQLACVEVETGKLVWRQNLKDFHMLPYDQKSGNGSSPILLAGNVIVHFKGASRPGLNGPDAVACVAFDPQTGALKWFRDVGEGGHRPNHFSIGGGLIEGKPTVLVNTGLALYGLDAATGDELWKFAFWKEFADLAADTNIPPNWRLSYAGQMAQTENNYVVSGFMLAHHQRQSRTFCIRINDGKPERVWDSKDITTWRSCNFMIADGKVYADDQDMCQWFHRTNGLNATLTLEAMARGESGLIDKMDTLGHKNNEIYRPPRPADRGALACIGLADGAIIWSSNALKGDRIRDTPDRLQRVEELEARDQRYSRAGKLLGRPDFFEALKNDQPDEGCYRGSPWFIKAGNYLIGHANDGVRIGKLSDNGLELIARFGDPGAPTLSPPVLADGRLFLRKYNEVIAPAYAKGNLICYDLRTETEPAR